MATLKQVCQQTKLPQRTIQEIARDLGINTSGELSDSDISRIVERHSNQGQKSQGNQNQNPNNSQQATRTQTNAKIAGDGIKSLVTKARNSVKRNIKAEIIVGGIGDALTEIAEGNFSDIESEVIESLKEFSHFWETETNLLIEAEVSEVPLLCPSSEELESVEQLEVTFRNSPIINESKEKESDLADIN
jgi:hypothetical protein